MSSERNGELRCGVGGGGAARAGGRWAECKIQLPWKSQEILDTKYICLDTVRIKQAP